MKVKQVYLVVAPVIFFQQPLLEMIRVRIQLLFSHSYFFSSI